MIVEAINRTVYPHYTCEYNCDAINDPEKLKPGRGVIYISNKGQAEFGRVSSVRERDGVIDAAYVRYSTGDTAAATLLDDLRLVLVQTS